MLRPHDGSGRGGAMRRRRTMNRIEVLAGAAGAVGLYLGMFWGAHRLADWTSDDPVRLLVAVVLAAGWICVWVVIGLASSLLTALLTR